MQQVVDTVSISLKASPEITEAVNGMKPGEEFDLTVRCKLRDLDTEMLVANISEVQMIRGYEMPSEKEQEAQSDSSPVMMVMKRKKKNA